MSSAAARVDPDVANKDGSRPAFEAAPFARSAPPDAEWVPGRGLNAHPEAARFAFTPETAFRSVHVGKTKIAPGAMYKLMLGGIAPRPIALCGTLSPDGVPNLAPISWFQMVSHNPPLVMISFGGDSARRKDSERNLKESGVFCISSSSEPFVEALNSASVDAPRGISEFFYSHLTPVLGDVVKAPRVGESPFSMECEVDFTREWNNDEGQHTTTMVVGRVKALHMREDCLTPEGTLDPAKTLPVSRMGGLTYGRSTTGFDLSRPKWEETQNTPEVQAALKEERWGSSTSKVAESWP